MGNAHFQFKQFSIEQDRCAMKVGTDGVLLGAWADIASSKHVLDVGTGTGLIALMCAQRNPEAGIQAIEIDPESAGQAQENILKSKYSDRIILKHVSLQDFRSSQKFDAIICNPPFFKAGTRSPIKERQVARHTDTLSIGELLENSKALISDEGKLHMILPLDREQDLVQCAEQNDWYFERVTVVHPNTVRPPKRILVTCVTSPIEVKRDSLTIEKKERFDYTEEYIGLTSAFYPKMD